MRVATALVVVLAMLALVGTAHAIDFYEIQIYPTETDPQDHLQVELHSNSVTTAVGREAKEQIDPYQIHETIETTYGILPHVEIGQYFCTAKLGDHYEYAGSRTKMHFGIPQTMDWPVSFGGNIELDYMRHAAEDQPLTLEMRPIAESHLGPVTIVANLPFEKPFSGAGTHKGVTLSPQGEIEYEGLIYKWFSPAVEYYGDMGAIRSLPGVQNQQQFIVPALNFDFIPQLELNLGVGIGMTRASNGTFVKTIVGWTF
jgi:hypothetical protein